MTSRGMLLPRIHTALSSVVLLGRLIQTPSTLSEWGVHTKSWESAKARTRDLGLGLKGFDWVRRTDKFKATILYAICRQLRPSQVVETGVASGTSAVGILAALRDNDYGHLYSIDLPGASYTRDDGIPWVDPLDGRPTGWRVPPDLRGRWSLALGPSRKLLEETLLKLGSIDLFYHDSEHTEVNMDFEIRSAWAALRSGGILLVDNIDWSASFSKFIESHPAKTGILFPHLGLIQRAISP